MIDWLAHRVRATPDATATVETDSGAVQNYAALDTAVEATANRLAALGFEPGDHLGAVLETRPASVRLVHAAARTGCVLVPLSTRLAPAELAARIEHADLAGLICGVDTERAALDAAVKADEDTAVPIASVDAAMNDAVTSLGAVEPRARERARVSDRPDSGLDDPQVMLFTSGTTGDPKLVVLTARNLLSSAVASAFRLGVLPGDRWLDPLAIYHMGGLAPIVRAAVYGTAVVVADTRGGFDPAAIREALAARDCTGVSLVPAMLRKILDADENASEVGDSLASDTLRCVLLGGAPASADLIERCAREDVPVHPTYGMTETASQVATARPETAFSDSETVGQPLLATDISILDRAGEPVEPGETGELVVSGPSVTPGYYDPDATAAAISPEGFRTGDLGHRDEAGRLRITGRRNDRIVTGGENVDPAGVRTVLCEHPDVRDAAVVGLADPEYGQRVGALVVRVGGPEDGPSGGGRSDDDRSEDDLDAGALEAHSRQRLAGFETPRTIEFAASLPRTASGTIDRAAVRERLSEDSP